MIANIIPATRLPRLIGVRAGLPKTTDFFSYSVPFEMQNNVQVGQIVAINFRNKNITGLVVKIKEEEKLPGKLKNINKILYPLPLVTPSQIELINFISEYYAVAKSIVVKAMLPEIPKRQKTINNKQLTTNNKKKSGYKQRLLWYNNEDDILKFISKKIKNKLANKKQILILEPEIELIDKLINQLNLAENEVIKIHNEVAKTKFFQSWLEILSGRPKLIIGTKISVLLPFSNLGEIIIYHEHNWHHKQSDINPRYDARKVAEWLAKEHECQLTLTTPAPRVEMYYRLPAFAPNKPYWTTAGRLKIIDLKREKLKKNISDTKIIDLKQERLKGNYGLLSDTLFDTIKQKLNQNKKIFIFHNRKGLAQFISCADCGYIFKCPECQISLTYHSLDRKLYCHHCKFVREITPLCPNCQGPNIKFKGVGLESIKLESQKKKLSKDSIKTIDKSIKQFNNLAIKQFNIIIGTEFVLNKIDFNQFGLIAFTNFDQLLNYPDFRRQERAYQLFYQIKSQTQKTDFIIQTHEPENLVLKSIKLDKPELFYNSELENRKNLNYPPFSKIIKLSYQDKKEKNVLCQMTQVAQNLKKNKTLEVIGPIENVPRKIRSRFRYHIIIKAKPDFNIKKIVKFIPNDFIIDVEPEKLT